MISRARHASVTDGRDGSPSRPWVVWRSGRLGEATLPSPTRRHWPMTRAHLFMTLKNGLIAFLLGTALLLCGCATSHHLAGAVNGPDYTSAHGGFTVPFPVSPEVGGRVLKDTSQSVTFGAANNT